MKNMFLSFIAATLVAIELLMSGCSYKSSDVLDDGQNSNVPSSKYSDISSNVTSNSDDFSKKLIDPFEGLEVQFDGIAPYCTVSFNNSKCSVEVQNYVEYSIDEKEVKTSGYFKNGEEVTVYAFLVHVSLLIYRELSRSTSYRSFSPLCNSRRQVPFRKQHLCRSFSVYFHSCQVRCLRVSSEPLPFYR